jgi:transcriptional regulator with XRE-family HTH domain
MVAVEILSSSEVALQLAARHRTIRLEQALTQQGLADRADVSLGSLKRFERTGKVSLETLIKLAIALNRISAFAALFAPLRFRSLDEVIEPSLPRRKGDTLVMHRRGAPLSVLFRWSATNTQRVGRLVMRGHQTFFEFDAEFVASGQELSHRAGARRGELLGALRGEVGVGAASRARINERLAG